MNFYTIKFDSRVKKDFRSIQSQDIKRIKNAIAELSKNPRPEGCAKLKGDKHDYYRIRVGKYRVVYLVEDEILLILVVRVGHRKEIYKKL
ncbi:addiction module toxin, RelE/StbE family [Xenococcus sp. PCC 7305]|uniref:type II toxin-antitoxin system RelE family toxin n=1 Tax=Xenococcus sp. PCC 7305 TaxID=102125 RepID=UPI0002AC5EE9|nr:type II toxin-antitoxin system RelE/ParE family toxin [Xenococcus sp. PCC 7305]ELS03636.1 addiction module toxin, RelE/StbE family [Xenococcus sp. PCC 7305]